MAAMLYQLISEEMTRRTVQISPLFIESDSQLIRVVPEPTAPPLNDLITEIPAKPVQSSNVNVNTNVMTNVNIEVGAIQTKLAEPQYEPSPGLPTTLAEQPAVQRSSTSVKAHQQQTDTMKIKRTTIGM